MTAVEAPARADPRLIIPLDVPTTDDARRLAERLGEAASFYKIGLELLATDGMALARELKHAGAQVFLDWKLHDIPTTVERATSVIAGAGCEVMTVHGEPQVMAAAVKGAAGSGLGILAVTVLTSMSDADLVATGSAMAVQQLVEWRVKQAVEAGCAGVITSPREAALARRIGGPDFLVVTPGVRPDWSARNDQARAATPAEALRAGASHIVCGRPITAADDPREAARRVAAEMAQV